jgi:hypothetical protein
MLLAAVRSNAGHQNQGNMKASLGKFVVLPEDI